jgi:Tol biopolymer transport system component
VLSALDSSVSKVLMLGTTNLCYAGGYLLFIRQGALMAQAFDTLKLELNGDAVPVAEQVVYSPNYAHAAFSVSQNGVLILQTGESQTTHTAIFDAAGNRTHLIADANPISPRLSPDAKRVAFAVSDPLTRNADIWVNDLSRGASTRLTFAPTLEFNGAWSPRGDSVVYQSNRNAFYDLYIKSADGSGEDQALVISKRNKTPGEWSPDGHYLAYWSSSDPKTKQDIWLLPMAGERKPIPFLQTEFNELNPTFSSDSRWIAYQSDETGKPEIYARLVDGTGGKFKVSTNGGRRPIWRADKRKLYFTSMDRKLEVAYVNVTPTSIVVDSIKTMWDLESRNISGFAITDVSADGKQFIVPVTDSKLSAPPITLVQNWDEELKKK